MKNFNQFVTEVTGAAGIWNQTPVTYNQTDPFDLANPSVLKRVNEFVNDDGITDRLPGGLSLEIKTEAVANGSWKVYAEIK